MDILLMIILGYALYRMAVSFNVSPWRWVMRYISSFMVSVMGLSVVLYAIYGQSFVKDIETFKRVTTVILPFTLLWEVLLFFFFRSRIIRYVAELDRIDNINDPNYTPPTPPPPPTPKAPKEDSKDLSYFR